MFRILATSVRGHSTLIGNVSVHPVDPDAVPSGVGAEFKTLQNVRGYVLRELNGLSSYHAVTVVDSDGAEVARGVRAGRNGTGKRWTWKYSTPGRLDGAKAEVSTSHLRDEECGDVSHPRDGRVVPVG